MEIVTENLPALTPQINGKALVTLADDQPNLLPMPIQVGLVIARVEAVREIVSKVFKEDIHFGKIPGTGEKKTLLKSGFDMLCLAFQFSPEFIKQPESVESDKIINVVYKCRLIHSPTGRVIATGDGSCNSKEEKYRWTTMAKKCPACNAEAIIKGRAEYGGGWVCFEKKGGCKAKYRDGDPAIEGQVTGRIENDNPWNYHNTLTKMAQKRAGMAAIITACGLSSDFTQDMEDFSEPMPAKGIPGMPLHEIPRRHSDSFGEDERDRYDHNRFQEEREKMENPPLPEDEHPTIQRDAEETDPSGLKGQTLQAYKGVALELRACKTKNDFEKLKLLMQADKERYIHPQITALVNQAYLNLFPRQTNLEKKAA